jgi:long-chain acyl-CoA synthetase
VVSVGVPVYNTQAKVIDDRGQEIAVGRMGEIAISGPQVIPGYWKRSEENGEVLREGWLLTGDMGTMDAEGWFYVLDRKKDMINASGFKVWPREVEEVLYEHPNVREAAVVGVPDTYRGETVRAVVSLRTDAIVSAAQLIDFCRERLASYKCPREVMVVEELPKTASGKILRRKLRTNEVAEGE